MLSNFGYVKILNEAWQSPSNPIENYIGYIKRYYYKLKLQTFSKPNVVNGKNLNDVKMEDQIK